jgi:hypothetical protein
MAINEIKEWILVISGSISMIPVALGVVLTVAQYRLK